MVTDSISVLHIQMETCYTVRVLVFYQLIAIISPSPELDSPSPEPDGCSASVVDGAGAVVLSSVVDGACVVVVLSSLSEQVGEVQSHTFNRSFHTRPPGHGRNRG